MTLPMALRQLSLPRMLWLRLPERWRTPLGWGAIIWIVVFWRLGYSSLLDPDEAHYAELTREMVRAGSWLVPLLDGKPFIDKPVLFHWLQGGATALLGPTEFAVRLPSALAALALFAVTRWVGEALYDRETGQWGAVMFATIPATFALASVGLFDMVFTAFLFSALGCLLVAWRRGSGRSEYAGYALLALAVMTKGPIALLLIGMFLGAAAVASQDTREVLRALHWKTGLMGVVLAASPWFIWMDGRFGHEFVQGYLLAGNLWYFTQPTVFSGRSISHTFYARAFAGAFFPWSFVIVGRALDAARRKVTLDTPEILLWIWVALVIGFFSAARFKLDHYIFPAAPACCLIAARAWRDGRLDSGRRLRGTRWSIFLIGAVLVAAGSFAWVSMFNLSLDLPQSAVLLPASLILGGVGLLWLMWRHDWGVPRTPLVLVVMLLATYATVVAVGFPVLESTRATALVGQRIARTTSASAPVGLYRLERWRASLRYYVGRPVEPLETPDAVLSFLSRQEPVYIVMLRREYDSLRAQGYPIHMVLRRRAVVGTEGTGLRKQRWDFLVVATNVPHHHALAAPGGGAPPR